MISNPKIAWVAYLLLKHYKMIKLEIIVKQNLFSWLTGEYHIELECFKNSIYDSIEHNAMVSQRIAIPAEYHIVECEFNETLWNQSLFYGPMV